MVVLGLVDVFLFVYQLFSFLFSDFCYLKSCIIFVLFPGFHGYFFIILFAVFSVIPSSIMVSVSQCVLNPILASGVCIHVSFCFARSFHI